MMLSEAFVSSDFFHLRFHGCGFGTVGWNNVGYPQSTSTNDRIKLSRFTSGPDTKPAAILRVRIWVVANDGCTMDLTSSEELGARICRTGTNLRHAGWIETPGGRLITKPKVGILASSAESCHAIDFLTLTHSAPREIRKRPQITPRRLQTALASAQKASSIYLKSASFSRFANQLWRIDGSEGAGQAV
jgi:hypothetical protein